MVEWRGVIYAICVVGVTAGAAVQIVQGDLLAGGLTAGIAVALGLHIEDD